MISESVHLRTAATQFAAPTIDGKSASDMCRDSVAVWQVDLVYSSYQLNFPYHNALLHLHYVTQWLSL